ncbi:unnamed protein product [Angiostrongylus costaricensis]|uniref:Homeobox domain-containing protein n=1 Tax=Angiostrongylus costaricensis TaxID=334426 RepID=A0A0R3PMJ2_ANGCS|nr:unnamed protein product [Angiostrongylus costaricensis]
MNKEVALFEKDDDLPSNRAVSPASSSGSSTQSTTAAHSSRGASGSSNHEEQFPIFHTVMKKKSKVRRSQSQHELGEQAYPRPEVAIVHALSRPASLGLKKPEVRQ